MSYIVKNCPCLKSQISYKDKLWINGCSELGKVGSRMCCQDITDCVIKQVIENCKEVENIENVKILYDAAQSGMFLQANRILKLLDIEEINK